MGTCSIDNKIEFSEYSKLGLTKKDVYQYYLETGTIGSPEVVKYRLDKLNNAEYPNIPETELNTKHGRHTVRSVNNWLSKLSNSLGVKYNIVTSEEALDLHNKAGETYSNQTAFFFNGEAYYVEGTITPESAVHEFMHPFVKMIIKTNSDLAESLYNELYQTEEGKAIVDRVAALYKNKSAEEQMEEVLVRSLTESLLLTEHKPGFHAWLVDFLVAIKQALRKIFGKSIEIHKLNPNTTLRELADILSKGNLVEMDAAIYTDEEVFDYLIKYEDFTKNFADFNRTQQTDDIQRVIDNIYNISVAQIKALETVPELSNLADLLINEVDSGLLNQVKNNTVSIQSNVELLTTIEKLDAKGTAEAKKVLNDRLINLTNTLFKINDVLKIMDTQLDDIKNLDDKEKLKTFAYYTTFLENWEETLATVRSASLKSIDKNELTEFSRDLHDNHEKVKRKVKELKTNALVDIMYDQLSPAANKAKQRFDEVEKFRKNAPQWQRDQHYRDFHNMTEAQYKEYQALKSAGKFNDIQYITYHNMWLNGLELTKEKIRQVLMGEVGDASVVNSMFETASLSTDPAINSVYNYIQSRIAEYQILAKDRFENYLEAIKPHIKKNGGKFQTRGALGEKFGFKDRVARVLKGELIEEQEWVFLNEWKDWRADKAILEHKVDTAYKKHFETNSDVDLKAWEDAKQELYDWNNTYMNDKYSSEYYIPEKLLTKDVIGRDVKEARNEIFNNMKLVQDNENLTHMEQIKMINDLWREHALLTSLHNADGTMKTGHELAMAERMKEYNEARGKFSTFVERPDEFQDAYNDHIEYLDSLKIPKFVRDAAGVLIKNPDYTNLIDEWLNANTTVVLKNSVADAKSKLLERRKELLEAMVAANKSIFDDTPFKTLINDMIKLVNDPNYNQPDGFKASPEIREKVRKAHETIEANLNKLYDYKSGGLTKLESIRLEELQKLDDSGLITSVEKEEKRKLLSKQLNGETSLGLDPTVIAELKGIDFQLSKMGSKNPTVYFKNAMISIFRGNQQLTDAFIKFVDDSGTEIDFLEDGTPGEYLQFILSLDPNDIGKMSADLETFVKENFYEKESYSFDDSKFIKKLVLTDLWNYNSGNNVLDYKTKMLKDKNGKNIGLIKDSEGNFRFPSKAYQQRIVKDEYVTERIVGKTIDNRGRWLPKQEASNKYRNTDYYKLKDEDPDNFAFMETVKEEFLKSQELADDKDKLYLSYPRTRKTNLENVRTGNLFRYQRRAKEFWYGTGDDLSELGISGELANADLVGETKGQIFDHVDSSMPVKGVARLRDIRDNSTDILKTIPEYMASIYHKEGAKQASAYATSVEDVIEKKEGPKGQNRKDLPSVDANTRMHNTFNFWSKRNSTTRARVISALIDRDINGVQVESTFFPKAYRLEKGISAVNKASAFRSFSANIEAGLKNYAQIKLTTITHALSFDEINPYDGLVGEAWALKAAGEISANIRSRGMKGYNEQLTQIFDPLGRSEDVMGDNLSRTAVGDLLDLKFLQKFRKWAELQGGLQNFGSLMHNKKVSITQNGRTKKIPYLNAFELVDGRIQSKQGVDPDYALSYNKDGKLVEGKKLIEHRLKMQNVILTWNGAFARKDKPLIERNIIIKQFFFFKNHLIPMASKRYAFSSGTNGTLIKKRMNWTTGKAEYGHHIGALRALFNFTRSTLSLKLPYMTKEEIVHVMFLLNSVVIGSVIMPFLKGLVTMFKWGDDDEEDTNKIDYKAMRNRSGYLTSETSNEIGFTTLPKNEFKLDGYMMNQAAYFLSQTTDEYNSINITNAHGFKEYIKSLNPTPINANMQTNLAAKIIGYASGQNSTTYAKDSGPYFFQQGDFENGKYYDVLFDFFGVNGKSLDPVKALEDYESFKKTN